MTNRGITFTVVAFALALAAPTPALAVCGQQGSASDSGASASGQCMKEYQAVAKACGAGKPECQTLAKQWESKWKEKSGFLDSSKSPTRPAGVPDKSTLPGKGQAVGKFFLPDDAKSKPGGVGARSGGTIEENPEGMKESSKGMKESSKGIILQNPGGQQGIILQNPGAGLHVTPDPGAGRAGPTR